MSEGYRDDSMAGGGPEAVLKACFRAAVAAADPHHCLPLHLPPRPKGRTLVLGAGKAAASMARAVEVNWHGDVEGVVVTRYGHGESCEHIRVIEAGHPLPDDRGEEAAREMLALARELTADDLVLFLVSGGGSSLLSLPADGIAVYDKRDVMRRLLRSGAPIGEMNCVRKHLSAIKGGWLAEAAAPARVVTLAISDVPGDDPSTIASGPTVADTTTLGEAREVLRRHGIAHSPAVARYLGEPAHETPGPDTPALRAAEFRVIARPIDGLRAAAETAREAGLATLVLGDRIEGEAADVGICHAGIARAVREHGLPLAPPAVIISGGETTVTVRGDGRGGRNGEFLLGVFGAVAGEPGIHALAGDTDGIDGVEDNAGAWYTPADAEAAVGKGLTPFDCLANNDAYGFFDALGRLIVTGPTRTNINDFRALLIEA